MRIFLVLIFSLAFAFADRDGGPYIGIGYGSSNYKSDGLYASMKEDKSESLTWYGGAYINKHLSVELGYVKMMGKGYEVDDTKNLDYSLYSVSTLVHYAFFDDILDFYARFGAGKMSLSGEDGSSFIYGLGTSVRISELLSIKLAYDIYEFGFDETKNGSADYKMHIYYPNVAVEFQF